MDRNIMYFDCNCIFPMQWVHPMRWVFHTISDKVNELVKDIPGSNGIHGGFAPNGVGDLSGDQFPDIVTPTNWYKNPGKNKDGAWEYHK